MFATIRNVFTFIVIALAVPAFAGDTVLTVSGAIGAPAESEIREFDMDALRALPAERFETTTIWTEGEQQFEGVPLLVLLEHVGATGNTIRAVALNDYAVSIPVADAVVDGPIVAYARNGDEMSVRDKGPLWIIYPFDDKEIYKSELYYSRSIWQLERIEIVTED